MLGFARTLRRSAELAPPADRYVEMIDAAAGQMAGLLDDLSLLARISAGRWEPQLAPVAARELAAGAADAADADVVVSGNGEPVAVERDSTTRALAALAMAAARHGGHSRVELRVDGNAFVVAPVAADVGPILLGEDLRDLGSAFAVAVVRALGGDVAHAGDTVVVRLPRAEGGQAVTASLPGAAGR